MTDRETIRFLPEYSGRAHIYEIIIAKTDELRIF